MKIVASKETIEKRRALLAENIEPFQDSFFPTEEDLEKYLYNNDEAMRYIDFFLYLCDTATDLTEEEVRIKEKIIKYIDLLVEEPKKKK